MTHPSLVEAAAGKIYALQPATIACEGNTAYLILPGNGPVDFSLTDQVAEVVEALEGWAARLPGPAPDGDDGPAGAAAPAPASSAPSPWEEWRAWRQIAAPRSAGNWEALTPAAVIAYIRGSAELMKTLGDLVDGLEEAWLGNEARAPDNQLQQDLARVLDQANPAQLFNDKGRVVLAEVAQILTGRRKTAGSIYHRCRAVADAIEAPPTTTTTASSKADPGVKRKAGQAGRE